MTELDSPLFYLVTVWIDIDSADEWRQWMRTVHLPDVVDTGCFEEAWMCRQADDDREDRLAFRMIYLARSRAHFERYEAEFAASLQADHTTRYADKFDATRSVCDVIETFKN